MRKLSLDLGTKTCGLAMTDEMNIIASAYKTIYFEEKQFNVLFQELSQILNKYDIDTFVIGYPLRSNGSKSERTEMIETIALEIKNRFNKKVFLVDEYGSTIKAQKILKDAKMSIAKRKELKDTLAAVLILQDFLNFGGKELK
ncbi:Holliday junction resolvase RuvX [Mycoplasmopsis gallinarum]|uniref:Putative pre-16S rRNA nuclease n=1 Tax=Mycoplasmopsis gallinarum TaxID=29557 RepID=A0A168R926_9BACT|nr:Holliday junction resolvase RuvX [Mycoplasmopsis gallinarum]OAB48734.1 putative Holliday junction resolvase YggF [Mycoplasmopsis gallinarum]